MKNFKLKFSRGSLLKANLFILVSILILTSSSLNAQAASILQAINNAASNQTGSSPSVSNTNNNSSSILQNINSAAVSINNSANSVSSSNSFVSTAQSCSIPYVAGRIIVNFSGASIRSDREESRSRVSTNANIPAGTYRVTLYGYDEYSERRDVTQPNERYYVRLSNGVNTNSLSDLPDRIVLGQRTEVVNNSLVIPSNVTSITAVHSVYPDNSSPNSITPGCAAFDLISTPPPPTQTLSGSCSVSPNSVNVGGYLNWTASASGGTGSYSYSWTGTDGLYGNSSYVSRVYSTSGTKTGTVTITSGSQSITRNCSAVVNGNPVNNNLSVSCSPSRSNIDIDENVTWYAYASGGDGSYDYDWDGTDGLNGNSRNLTWSYDDDGTKTADITVESGGQTASASCYVYVDDDQSYNSDLSVSCYASPSNPQVGSRMNWYVNVYGGDGDYDYDWTGTDGLDSSSRSPSMTYYNVGSKRATVRVEDGSGESDSATCYANVNSVLAFTQEYQPPMASAVYLSQIPYTGVADNYKLYSFLGILALFSIWISYIIISFKRNNGELN